MVSFFPSDYCRYLKKTLNLTFSNEFIFCADIQLSALFEKLTSIKAKSGIRYVSLMDVKLSEGKIEKYGLSFKYGGQEVDILWHSKSGHKYLVSDVDIDCADIMFEFGNFNIEKCLVQIKPNWSLVPFPESQIESLIFTKQKFSVSLPFFKCLSNQLTPVFEKAAGFKTNEQTSLNLLTFDRFMYDQGTVSKLNFTLYVNHNWNPITVLWKSKSGRLYGINDEDIDCNDIEFSFEHFDAALYIKQMYPNVKLPFKLKDLSYELVVTRINLDCTLALKLKPEALPIADNIITELADFIEDWNIKSEKRDREEGVIHNSHGIFDSSDTIIYDMDLGSVGWPFFKKLLSFLSKKNYFLRVEIL